MWRRLASVVVMGLLLVAVACTRGNDADTGTPGDTRRPDSGASDRDRTPTSTAAPLPEQRTEVAGARWGDRLAVAGGLTAEGDASARFDLYDAESDTWARGPDLPVPLHHTALAVLDGRLYVIGGYSIRGGRWTPEAAVHSVSEEGGWSEEPSLRTARGALAAASTGERILVAGGVNGAEVLASTEVLASGTTSWEEGPSLREAREHLALATAGADVYAIAGRVGGLDRNLASVEVLRADRADRWERAGTLE